MFPLIVGLPGLIAIVVCIRRGLKEAFLWVYLPTLLLLPDDYRWPILGHLSFHEAAIIPIGVCFLLSSWRTWRFSLTDFLLFSYCLITVISEFSNKNFYEARNVALRDTTYVIFPYMLAKGMFWRGNLGLEVAKRVTILLTIVSIVSVYEFKMTVDLFESLVHPFFSTMHSVITFRYGLTRVAGPFGHALLAGMILLVGYRLARWLEWSGYWRRRVPFFGVSAVRFCEVCIAAGAAMTVARGAWLGAVMGSLVVLVGRARDRLRTLAVTLAVILVVGPPLYWGVRSYLSPAPSQAIPLSEQTATYRLDLLIDYLPIVEQRPTLGYGRNAAPVVNGMWSTDNHYLLIALTNGIYALALWIAVLAWMLTRLLRFGLQRLSDDPRGSLATTLAGACTLYAVALSTVWLGGQNGPLLYMIWGWGEGLLLSPALAVEHATERSLSRAVVFPFERVMAGTIIPVARALD